MKLYNQHTTMAKFRYLKIFILGIVCVSIQLQSFGQTEGMKLIDKVVAQIGDEIILLSDIQNQRLQMIQDGMEGDASTDCAILEEFMYEKLLVNQAKLDSIEVPDDMVNQEMEQRIRYIADQIGSIEKLEEFYGKSVAKIKAEFFEAIKKRILAERMKEQITQNVRITPKEIKAFYNSLPEDSIPYINSSVTVAHLVLYPEITQADKDKAKNTLAKIRQDVLDGKLSFSAAATRHSDDMGSRIQGGDLGWQTRGTMVPAFEAALFKLEANEISDIVETQFGFHVIQLLDRKGDNFHSRHILIQPKISDQALVKSATRIDSIYNAIKRGTITFSEAARLFSDDDASKYNGGQILNPYTQDYLWDLQNINAIDPQMYQMVQTLSPGKMTTPALYTNVMERNKEGVRIVKLISKTKPHVASLNTDRQLIEQAALNKKKQQVIDDWITQKIRKNFVLIAPEYMSGCDFKYDWVNTQESASN
ncbi:MAG: foldase protein PrsA [Crocinitomicaceae bacterium]